VNVELLPDASYVFVTIGLFHGAFVSYPRIVVPVGRFSAADLENIATEGSELGGTAYAIYSN
jgi:hypothetical protein